MPEEPRHLPYPFTVPPGGGLDLRSPGDQTPVGSYRIFTNIESVSPDGAPCSRRSAKRLFAPAAVAVHSQELLIDQTQQLADFLFGTGTQIVNSAGTVVDGFYSGNPLTIVDYREQGNSVAWAIVADSLRMSKISLTSAAAFLRYKLGISPPGAAPPYIGASAPAVSSIYATTPGSASTTVNPTVATQAGSLNVWQNVNNATGPPDSNFATVTLYGSSGQVNTSNGLILTGCGFNASAGATIAGIKVDIAHEQFSGTSAVYDSVISLTGTTSSQNKNSFTAWGDHVPQTYSYGGASDTWGATITADQLNSPNFGVTITIECTLLPGNGANAGIDGVTITAYYATVAGALNSSVGIGYDWRYTYYNQVTKAESNPSAIQPTLLDVVNQSVLLTPGAVSLDAQVDTIRWWRRGGALPDTWRLVGSTPNAGGTILTAVEDGGQTQSTYTTASPHRILTGTTVVIAGVADAGFNGTFTVTGTPTANTFTVANTNPAPNATSSGGTFAASLVDNQSDLAISTAPVISLLNDVPITTVDNQGRTIYEQPLPYIWGPYTGGSLFGSGDPYRPGYVYWSNPYNPDGWGSINNVEVAAPSDVLLPGFLWNARIFVFSQDRLWEGFPLVVGEVTGYQFFDAGAGHGLANPWAFEANQHSPFVWYQTLSAGIVQWAGGGPAISITDAKLAPLFIGNQAVGTVGPVETYYPVLQQPFALGNPNTLYYRMRYYNGELHFSYLDTQSNPQVLIYDVIRTRWRHASYPWGVTSWKNVTRTQAQVVPPASGPYVPLIGLGEVLLLGGSDGGVYYESGTFGGADNDVAGASVPFTCQFRTPYVADPDPEADKQYFNVILDANPNLVNITATANFGDGTVTGPAIPAITGANARIQTPIPLGDTYARDFQLDLTWTSANLVTIYGMELLYVLDKVPITHFHLTSSSFGMPNWFTVYDGYLTLRSTGTVTITLTLDDGTHFVMTETVPATGNLRLKNYLDGLPFNKGKVLAIDIDGASKFRLYNEDSYLRLMPWGGSDFAIVTPFDV